MLRAAFILLFYISSAGQLVGESARQLALVRLTEMFTSPGNIEGVIKGLKGFIEANCSSKEPCIASYLVRQLRGIYPIPNYAAKIGVSPIVLLALETGEFLPNNELHERILSTLGDIEIERYHKMFGLEKATKYAHLQNSFRYSSANIANFLENSRKAIEVERLATALNDVLGRAPRSGISQAILEKVDSDVAQNFLSTLTLFEENYPDLYSSLKEAVKEVNETRQHSIEKVEDLDKSFKNRAESPPVLN